MILKIGVLGAGHLGKIHLKILQNMPQFDLVGFYDVNVAHGKKTSTELNIPFFEDPSVLMQQIDVADIVTPTSAHFDAAQLALEHNKSFFVEKPFTSTLLQATQLMQIAQEKKLLIQVGHVERFNPAFLAAQNYLQQPLFIEAHRLSEFNPRGTDVSVVMDLMIHDIDIILKSVSSPVKSVHANSVAVISNNPDIANARIEFENGCVANLTASRISMKKMRKMRIFQKDAYLSIDFLEKQLEVFRLENTLEEDDFAINIPLGDGKGFKRVHFEKPELFSNNAIQEELAAFHDAYIHKKMPIVSAEDGFRALQIAQEIIKQKKSN